MKKDLSMKIRAIIAVSILMVVLCLTLGVFLSEQSRRIMKMLIDGRMLDTVKTAADMLDGDILETVTGDFDDVNTEGHQTLYKTLSYFQNNIGLEFIYAARRTGDSSFILVVNPSEESTRKIGARLQYTESLRRAEAGMAAVDVRASANESGHFYSAYSPVYDSSGQVAGVVAADFQADWYNHEVNRIGWYILLACLLFVVVGISLVLFIMRALSRTIRTITGDLADLAKDMSGLTRDVSDNSGKSSPYLVTSMRELGECVSGLRDEMRDYVTHAKTQANSMITAMASDYRAV